MRWTGRASGEAPCLSPGPPVHGARHSFFFVTRQLPTSLLPLLSPAGAFLSSLSAGPLFRHPLPHPSRPPPTPGHKPGAGSTGGASPFSSSAGRCGGSISLSCHPPFPLFVIRRLDRRIQRTVETTSSIGDDGPAGWIRRLNRRMTQEGASHPPLLPFFVIRRLDRRIQRNVKTTPVPEMFLCQMDSPDKPANDDPVIGDQLSVIRTESSERCRWGRWPSHAFPSPITDHCPLITDHRHLITGPSPDGLIGGSSRKGGAVHALGGSGVSEDRRLMSMTGLWRASPKGRERSCILALVATQWPWRHGKTLPLLRENRLMGRLGGRLWPNMVTARYADFPQGTCQPPAAALRNGPRGPKTARARALRGILI